MVGTCIILWEFKLLNKDVLSHKIKEPFGVIFFLVILLLLLGFVFLLGMLADSIRHLIEEMFLVPKWSEYRIPKENRDKSIETLVREWDLYEKVHDSEYYYLEFFGNVAISLAFLWAVIRLMYSCYFCLGTMDKFWEILWIISIFLVRPFLAPAFWKWQEWAEKWKKSQDLPEEFEKLQELTKCECQIFRSRLGDGFKNAIKNVFCFRFFDFPATILSILILFFIQLKEIISPQAFHFYFIGVIMITTSFEVYIVRFKRYTEMLKMFFIKKVAKK